jgi:recombination protein RecR
MAFYLLERDRDGGRTLSQALAEALDNVGHCKRCRMLTESEYCPICASTQRDVAQPSSSRVDFAAATSC